MHSLALATHTSSGMVSSSFVSAIDVTSNYPLAENFQNSSLHGNADSLQLSLPVVINAASLIGSVCNFSRASAPAATSAWLLPSTCGTSFQPLMGSAYLYQHSSTAMVSGVTGQNQIPMASASYPSIFEWDITGNAEKSSSTLGDFTLTVIDQNTAGCSRSMTAQYDKTSDANVMVPVYPTLSARLVQAAPSQNPNKDHSLSLPYQEGSQVYYYDQNSLGTLLSGDHGPCLQSYGSVPYAGSSAAASQPEMVTVLKEVQPTNVLPSVSTHGIYYSLPTQPITETNFQVMETSLGMEASLGLQPPSQTFCLPQSPEFPNSCSSRNIQILERNPPTALGDISIITPVQSSSDFLALPPNQSQEQTEIKNLCEIKTMLSEPLDAYQIAMENQDPPLLPLDIPEIHQLLASIGPLDQEEKPHSENIHLGNNILSLEDQGPLENGIEFSSGFADLTALVEDILLPELFSSLKDFDQPECPTTSKSNDTRAIMVNQGQETTSAIKSPSDPVKNNKNKASESPDGTPQAKMQPRDLECTLEGEGAHGDADSIGAPEHTSKHSNSKPQKAASSRNSKAKCHGQEKTKRTRENNSRKAEEKQQPGNKVKMEEKPTVPKLKRKRNQPELCQETFKKPRSCPGMHMLESVQVSHALGKKNDKKTGLSSSRAPGNSGSTQGPRPCPAMKPWLAVKGPEKSQVKAQSPDISAEREGPSPPIYEPPQPGKVKLVPLPFLTLEKPPPRPVINQRPQSLASRRPTAAYPAQPGPASSTQPMAVNQSQPATANPSWMHPAKPAQPILTSATQSGLTSSTQPSAPRSAASRPAPYKTSSCTSLQWHPISTILTKPQSQLPKPQNQYLLQDFALQPIPWRKPNVPGQVVSTPITKHQRPEREAMKKKAQQERENAAKHTALGRVQFFIEREREMEIARYYGYTM
ncbi:hypothetical protein H1C71_034502 [Ictidomys tridecemlineatus]|uniref:uncharacterized protein C2orf78 n=1 Tax=Ictidomys tridecemlineatus TaxID=43179 RepID=UPI00038BF40B|nr:uncharacterized protein C2orf78 [Ictidomys tridecemlineatus]KAG3267063.1 hypothetical protein H1C71_034502 [Ictidomys tridecemlineatus]